MGSVTVIFMLPLMIFYMLFASVTSTLTGDGKATIELEHAPDQGLVWEYIEEDEPRIDFLGTETKDGKQVFTFRSKGAFAYLVNIYEYLELTDNPRGYFYDLKFTDQNGNEQKYYAYSYPHPEKYYNDITLYAPGEYLDFSYTAKALDAVDGAYWDVYFNDEPFHLYTPQTASPEQEFTIVYAHGVNPPEDFTEEVYYTYRTDDRDYEKLTVKYTFTDGEMTITETREIFNGENG